MGIDEKMEKEEWVQWFVGKVLPHPYNEWGISKEEFRYVSGWNDLRILILERLNNGRKNED